MKLDKSAKLFQLLYVYMLSNVTLSVRLKFDSEILRLIYLVFIRCTGVHYFSVPTLFFPLSFKTHELQLSTQRQENHAFSNFQKPATCSLLKTKKRNCKKQLQPTWWFEAHNVIIVYILYYYLLTLFLLLKITYSMKILPHSSI